VANRLIERKLRKVSARLRALNSELVILEPQYLQQSQEAQDARLEALVADTSGSERSGRLAARHAEVTNRRRQAVSQEIADLEALQDDLLDRLARP
jgi:hypothetical protein